MNNQLEKLEKIIKKINSLKDKLLFLENKKNNIIIKLYNKNKDKFLEYSTKTNIIKNDNTQYEDNFLSDISSDVSDY